jgi:hypothetical protein
MRPASDELIRNYLAGIEAVDLGPGETESYTMIWDQKDEQGQPVSYGYYTFSIPGGGTMTDTAIIGGVYILPSEGVIEKTIITNDSQDSGSTKITLEKVELTKKGIQFYAFNDDYRISDVEQQIESFPQASYCLDSGPIKQVAHASIVGGGSNLEGLKYVWTMYTPVPNNTKSLTFSITDFWGLGKTWEFNISLR